MQATESVPKCTEVGLQDQIVESVLRDVYVVTIEDGEDGMKIAKCPELNIVTQGRSIDDAQHNAIEAIELMREEMGKTKEFSMDVRPRR